MARTMKSQVDISDLAKLLKELGTKVNERLGALEAAGDIKPVKRLARAIDQLRQSIAGTLHTLTYGPLPAVGDVMVADGSGDTGKVVTVDSEELVIRVAEQVISKETIPAHDMTAYWDDEVEGWLDLQTGDQWVSAK